MSQKIAFVGVGRMGANMARRLKDCNFSVTAVYDAHAPSAATARPAHHALLYGAQLFLLGACGCADQPARECGESQPHAASAAIPTLRPLRPLRRPLRHTLRHTLREANAPHRRGRQRRPGRLWGSGRRCAKETRCPGRQ